MIIDMSGVVHQDAQLDYLPRQLPELKKHTTVRLCYLTDRPHLNGKRGIIVDGPMAHPSTIKANEETLREYQRFTKSRAKEDSGKESGLSPKRQRIQEPKLAMANLMLFLIQLDDHSANELTEITWEAGKVKHGPGMWDWNCKTCHQLEKITDDALTCCWNLKVGNIDSSGELRWREDTSASDRFKKYVPQADVVDGQTYGSTTLRHLLSILYFNT
jgi:hypothetical protein